MGSEPPYWDSDEERDRILADRIEAELARPAPDHWRRMRQARRILAMIAAALNGRHSWHEWLIKDAEPVGGYWREWGGQLLGLAFLAAMAVSAAELTGLIR